MTLLDQFYTTTEAAALLGLRPPSVRDAIRRGRLRTERKGAYNLISSTEIERYRSTVLGTHGWRERAKADSTATTPAAHRQRAYRGRKKQTTGTPEADR